MLQDLSLRHLHAFPFVGRGLTAYYDQAHLEHVVRPAIDRVLRRTGVDAKSYTRNDVLMAVLGLDPATTHVFTVPDGPYSGPGVANVVHDNATGMYQHLPWREINIEQNLISAVYECSENVAFNAQMLKFKIIFDEDSTSDCAVVFLWSMRRIPGGKTRERSS